MELIIDFDKINDHDKKEWLLITRKMMGIGYEAIEKRQIRKDYNETDNISKNHCNSL